MKTLDVLKDLPNRPYEERIKAMWGAFGVIAIIVVIFWSFFFTKGPKKDAPTDGSLSGLGDQLQQFQAELDKTKADINERFKALGINEEQKNPVHILKTELNAEGTQLIFEFEVANTSKDILNFRTEEGNNISLLDGEAELIPNRVYLNETSNFPKKVLANRTLTGYMSFPAPTNETVTLIVKNMFFESISGQTFEQSIAINVLTENSEQVDEQVKGEKTIRLPRE
jgi:hypothetical protein